MVAVDQQPDCRAGHRGTMEEQRIRDRALTPVGRRIHHRRMRPAGEADHHGRRPAAVEGHRLGGAQPLHIGSELRLGEPDAEVRLATVDFHKDHRPTAPEYPKRGHRMPGATVLRRWRMGVVDQPSALNQDGSTADGGTQLMPVRVRREIHLDRCAGR